MAALPNSLSGTTRKSRGFRTHAVIFAGVTALLAAVDWYTADPYWVHWVILGWGAGLAGHYWLAFMRKDSGATS